MINNNEFIFDCIEKAYLAYKIKRGSGKQNGLVMCLSAY